MARKFVEFCLVEETLFSVVLCIVYASYPGRVEPWQTAAMVLAFLIAASVTNAALFFEGGRRHRGKLNLWQKAAQCLAAVATTFVAFFAAFACFSFFSGLAIGPRSLVILSGLAGLDFGIIGLIGIQLAIGPDSENISQAGRTIEWTQGKPEHKRKKV